MKQLMIKKVNDPEVERIQDLKSYGILDTPDDSSFDRITKLASAICGTSIAAVTFIDQDRQWIKSSVGMGDLKETKRSDSFCTFTIQDETVLEVRDALKDSRFKNNKLVNGAPNIRFYAGAPLITPQGHRLGALCVIGLEPKALTDEQLEALKILSGQVVELMELRKLNRELIDSKKVIEDQQQLLINKARLQTIGELAGGVCHQINNPLAIIVGRSMILRSQLKQILPVGSELFKELDIIDQTSQRVSGILKSLRVYSKDMGQEVTESDLGELIDDALTLIQPKLKQNGIELKYNKIAELKLRINKNQISQVILDLLTNAIEAMEESTLKEIGIEVRDSANNVTVLISDTGKGIRNEDHFKVFEAFFTTKSRHFGVGLSNALNYISQHKGEIVLMKSEGPTIFKMIIPKAA